MKTLRLESRAAVVARVFVLLAISVPVLWDRELLGLIGLGALLLLWGPACLVAPVGGGRLLAILAESAAVGAVCGLMVHSAPAFASTLLVPTIVAGLTHRVRGVLLAMSLTLVVLVVVMALWIRDLSAGDATTLITWSMLALGAGLLASGASSVVLDADPLHPYRDARNLLRELLDLSDDLTGGLDSLTLGEALLSEVGDRVPAEALTLYVQRDGELARLTSTVQEQGHNPEAPEREELVARAAERGSVCVEGPSFAVPLRDRGRLIGVVSGVLAPGIEHATVRAALASLDADLLATAVRLDTALTFAAFRDAATTEERRRLARDLHDGVVQEIAYLGYLVDALAAGAATPTQASALHSLRERITAVVAELRGSVLTLRSQVAANESLGAALGRLARHLSEVSGIPVQVTLDEGTARLRPEVEAEVVRIGQEAMNNAVKHSQASLIDLHCQVDPPRVQLTVTDDGRGLQPGRSDSHGLQIMQERARLIGGDLVVATRDEGGTRVALSVGD